MLVKVFNKKTLTEDRRYFHISKVEVLREPGYECALYLEHSDKTVYFIAPDEYIEVWTGDE